MRATWIIATLGLGASLVFSQTQQKAAEAAAVFNKGASLSKAGKHKEAIIQFKKVVQLAPKDHQGFAAVAREYALLGDWSAAEKWFRQGLKVSPKNGELYAALAGAVWEKRKYNEAVGYLEKAMRLGFTHPEVYAQLGIAYLMQGKTKQAVPLLKKANELVPRTPQVLAALGSAQASLGDWVEAVEAYKGLSEAAPKSAQGPLLLGELYERKLRKFALAVDQYAEAQRRAPEARALALNTARAYQQMARYDKATEVISTALKGATGEEAGKLHLGLATLQMAQNLNEAAEAELLAAAKLLPKESSVLVQLGTVQQRLGKTDKAIASYEAAMATNPGDKTLALNLISAFNQIGDSVRAERAYKGYLARNPKDVEMALRLAQDQERRKDRVAAVATIREVLGRDPKNPMARQARMQMAQILSRDSKVDDAAAVLQAQAAEDRKNKSLTIDEKANVFLAWSTILKTAGRFSDAYAVLDSALGELKGNTSLALRKSSLLNEEKKYEEAISWLVSFLRGFAKDATVRRELARLLEAQQRLDEAAEQYRIILAQDPKNYDAVMAAAALMARQNLTEEAARMLEQSYAGMKKPLKPDSSEHIAAKRMLEQVSVYYERMQRPLEIIRIVDEHAALKPNDFVMRVKGIEAREKLGKSDEAIAYAKKVIEAYPDTSQMVWSELEKIYAAQNKQDVYAGYLEDLIVRFPPNEELVQRLKRALETQGVQEMFGPRLEALAGKSPRNRYIREHLMRAQVAKRDLEGAKASLQILLKMGGDAEASTRLSFARDLQAAGLEEEALAQCRAVLGMEAENRGALQMLVDILEKKGHFREAAEAIQPRLNAEPEDLPLLLKQAELFVRAKEYDKAQERYVAGLGRAKYPGQQEKFYAGIVEFARASGREQAIKEVLLREADRAEAPAVLWRPLHTLYETLGEEQEFFTLLRQKLAENPERDQWAQIGAELHEAAGRTEAALELYAEFFERVKKLEKPDLYAASLAQLASWQLKAGKKDGYIASMEEYSKLSPEPPGKALRMIEYADFLLEEGKSAEALRVADEVLSKSQSARPPRALFAQARAFEKLGNYGDALTAFQQTQIADPRLVAARDGMNRVKDVIRGAFEKADTDKDGKLSQEEAKISAEAFRKLDFSKDGFISLDEFQDGVVEKTIAIPTGGA